MKFPNATRQYMERNRRQFDHLVKITLSTTDPLLTLSRCQQAAEFAVTYPCGLWYSAPLEMMLQRMAADLPHPGAVSSVGKKNRFLHVFTKAYGHGGHTRVCERWIGAPDESHVHDVLLIDQQNEPFPIELQRIVTEKGGAVFRLQAQDYQAKAVELRALANDYAAVILFVHPHDVVPMLAFALPEFTTPIVYYNHADHVFWLGASLADVFINLRRLTVRLDQSKRGIQAGMQRLLPLPVRPALNSFHETREQMLAELGFPVDAKVMVSVASRWKFRSFAGLDFIATIKTILARNPQAVLLAIGPKQKDPVWRRAYLETEGRIRATGPVPSHKLDRYLRIADIGLESFPLGSTTALFDIAKHRVPCVALKLPTNSTDAFEEAGIICDTPEAYAERALRLLRGEGRDNRLYEVLVRDSFPEGFAARLREMYEAIPTRHIHRPAKTIPDCDITEFDCVIAENSRASLGNILRETRKRIAVRWRFFTGRSN